MTRCSVDAIVPWRGGPEDRERAWLWVQRQYARHLPDWTLTRADAPPGEWCKGRAVSAALATTAADVVVVADADVWCGGLLAAAAEVAAGAPWAIPHLMVHRLTRGSTAAVLSGADWVPRSTLTTQRPYRGVVGGGIVAVAREVIEAVPIDPRFLGWGQEDEAWALALYVLLGPPWRGTEPLLHLWHEPQLRISRRHGSAEGWGLRRRYLKCRHDPTAMRSLIEEAHVCLRTTDASLHDHPPRGIGGR